MQDQQIACFVVIATEKKKEVERRNDYVRALSCTAQGASQLTPQLWGRAVGRSDQQRLGAVPSAGCGPRRESGL